MTGLSVLSDCPPSRIMQAWNVHDLGGPCRTVNEAESRLLHWSDPCKPWRQRECAVDAVWQRDAVHFNTTL